MIDYKTEEEILLMKEGGNRLKKVVARLLPSIAPGQTTQDLDKRAEELIKIEGGESSFNKVENYHWSTCLSINEQVVHTPPSKRRLVEGDVLTVDIGVFYRGFHTDYATTFVVGGKKNPETEKFLAVGRETLDKAIAVAEPGRRLGEISERVEKNITGAGYFILKDLTGHGIGRELHENPYVFNYLEKPIDKTIVMKPGLVIAIEVIYSRGTEEIKHEKDNDWSIMSADGSLTACFEHTVAITKKGTLILT